MQALSGIIPPLITPLKNVDQLDNEAVNRLINRLIGAGVNGLFVLGTTGEGPSLTYQIRYEMVERACETAGHRVPVLVGVTDTSLTEAVHLAEHAAKCEATAVVAAAPYYFATDQAGLVRWFSQLADQSPLPLILYNMPGCVDISLEVETVERLSKHANIVGVKDSAGDLSEFSRFCSTFAADDFVVFMGPEELLPQAVDAGGDGGVCGGANLLPELYVGLFAAARRNDAGEIRRLNAVVQLVYDRIYKDPNGRMNYLPALKAAMSSVGLCSDLVAPPLPKVSDAHVRQIREYLPQIVSSAGASLTLVPA